MSVKNILDEIHRINKDAGRELAQLRKSQHKFFSIQPLFLALETYLATFPILGVDRRFLEHIHKDEETDAVQYCSISEDYSSLLEDYILDFMEKYRNGDMHFIQTVEERNEFVLFDQTAADQEKSPIVESLFNPYDQNSPSKETLEKSYDATMIALNRLLKSHPFAKVDETTIEKFMHECSHHPHLEFFMDVDDSNNIIIKTV